MRFGQHPNTYRTNPVPQVKMLQLSGILDLLDERNREAISSKLAYTDFLAMFVNDDVARRESKKFDTRLRSAQFRTTGGRQLP